MHIYGYSSFDFLYSDWCTADPIISAHSLAIWGLLRFYFHTLINLNWIIVVSLCHLTMDKYILKNIFLQKNFVIKLWQKMHIFVYKWVIPENIHTPPRAAFWNSEGEGGYLDLEFQRRGGFVDLEFRRRGGVPWLGIPKGRGELNGLDSRGNVSKKEEKSSD